MMVYLKNARGQQTIRNLSVWSIVRSWLYQMIHVRKEERSIMKIIF